MDLAGSTHTPQEKGENQTEEEFNHSMCMEWAQTQAWMCWWKEELLIVQEEMHWVLAFFEWKSSWRFEQANQRTGLEPSVQSGVVAYAHKQSMLSLQMAAHCATHWLPLMKNHGIILSWGKVGDIHIQPTSCGITFLMTSHPKQEQNIHNMNYEDHSRLIKILVPTFCKSMYLECICKKSDRLNKN